MRTSLYSSRGICRHERLSNFQGSAIRAEDKECGRARSRSSSRGRLSWRAPSPKARATGSGVVDPGLRQDRDVCRRLGTEKAIEGRTRSRSHSSGCRRGLSIETKHIRRVSEELMDA